MEKYGRCCLFFGLIQPDWVNMYTARAAMARLGSTGLRNIVEYLITDNSMYSSVISGRSGKSEDIQ